MTLIIYLLMLCALITIHEFGHFIAAKYFNIYVREFSIGFGSKLFQRKGKETTFSIRAIPLGGYNAMIESEEELQETIKNMEAANDQNAEELKALSVPRERTFYGVSPIKRIITLLAGPVFNIILAILICIGIYEVSPYKMLPPDTTIHNVVENTAAADAGIEIGDKIIKVIYADGIEFEPEDCYDLIIENQLHKGQMILTMQRGDKMVDITVNPRFDEESQSYLIGIQFGSYEYIKINPLEAAGYGVEYTFEMVGLTVQSIISLIRGSIGTESLTGTIGMYTYTEEAISYGALSLFALMANFSVSLGVFNLLPISITDGGKIVLSAIEMILGRRLNKKVENIIMYVGLAILLLLFLFTAYLDISKLF